MAGLLSNKRVRTIHLTDDCLDMGTYQLTLCGMMQPKDEDIETADEAEICGDCEQLMQNHTCYDEEPKDYEDVNFPN